LFFNETLLKTYSVELTHHAKNLYNQTLWTLRLWSNRTLFPLPSNGQSHEAGLKPWRWN